MNTQVGNGYCEFMFLVSVLDNGVLEKLVFRLLNISSQLRECAPICVCTWICLMFTYVSDLMDVELVQLHKILCSRSAPCLIFEQSPHVLISLGSHKLCIWTHTHTHVYA